MQVTYGPGLTLGRGISQHSSMRQRVERLELAILASPQIDYPECPVTHHFTPGLYRREMSIPAGAIVTGAIHKTENPLVVLKGRLHCVTEEGTREVVAGDIITCKPGVKNAVVALEDSRVANFLANPDNCTDTDALTERYTESKASELLGGADNKQLAANRAAESIEA